MIKFFFKFKKHTLGLFLANFPIFRAKKVFLKNLAVSRTKGHKGF